jgi:hypothetical protein
MEDLNKILLPVFAYTILLIKNQQNIKDENDTHRFCSIYFTMYEAVYMQA